MVKNDFKPSIKVKNRMFPNEIIVSICNFLPCSSLLNMTFIYGTLLKSATELRIKLFLYKHNVHDDPPIAHLICAVKHRSELSGLEVLNWLKNHNDFVDSPENKVPQPAHKYRDWRSVNPKIASFRYAAKNGDLEALQWLTSNFNYSRKNITYSRCWALEFEKFYRIVDLKVLEWVHNKFNLSEQDVFDCCTHNYNIFEVAAMGGQKDILFWLHSTFNIIENVSREDILNIFKRAAKRGRLEVIKYLYLVCNITREEAKITHLFYNIIGKGRERRGGASKIETYFEVLQWLHSTFNFPAKDIFSPFKAGAGGCQLHILQWLCDTFKMCDMFESSREEFLPAVQRAFEGVCEYGHPVPRRSEFCIFEVLQWLQNTFKLTRKEIKPVFHTAVEYCNTTILSWFKDTFNLRKKDLDSRIVVPLVSRGPDSTHTLVFYGKRADYRERIEIGSSGLEVLEWLCSTFNITRKDRDKTGHNYCDVAFAGAANNRNCHFIRKHAHYFGLEVLKWLHSKFNLTRKDVEVQLAKCDHDVLDWIQETYGNEIP
jgi:hypothetical protein